MIQTAPMQYFYYVSGHLSFEVATANYMASTGHPTGKAYYLYSRMNPSILYSSGLKQSLPAEKNSKPKISTLKDRKAYPKYLLFV